MNGGGLGVGHWAYGLLPHCAASAGMTRIRFHGCVLSRHADICHVGTPDKGLTVAEMAQNDNPEPTRVMWRMN